MRPLATQLNRIGVEPAVRSRLTFFGGLHWLRKSVPSTSGNAQAWAFVFAPNARPVMAALAVKALRRDSLFFMI
ncbi:hypothetical protein ACFL6K_00640 [Candidatus Latescibacterota bacterium]